jgi:galactokinase
MQMERLRAEFQSRFAASPRVFSAPGRVNLIGEHTDYNDGFALPMAIDRRTYVLAAPRADRKVVAHSQNLGQDFELELDRPGPPRRGSWGDYVEGVVRALLDAGFPLQGASLLIASDVPAGAGLSASAALELSVGLAMTVLGGTPEPDRIALALAGQKAEHEYVGTRCGIMDQFVSALGRAGSAVLIDCRSLEPRAVAMPLAEAVLVVCDTRVKHALASSAYNQRRHECEAGVARLRAVFPEIRALRDVTREGLQAQRALLSEVVYRRCLHVVSENERTLRAAAALVRGDLEEMGRLMNESHRSLRDDYEVSCAELDFAVELALTEPNLYGARMTGGGFGGCTISLCRPEAAERLVARIRDGFGEKFGVQPDLFVTRACDGARVEGDAE